MALVDPQPWSHDDEEKPWKPSSEATGVGGTSGNRKCKRRRQDYLEGLFLPTIGRSQAFLLRKTERIALANTHPANRHRLEYDDVRLQLAKLILGCSEMGDLPFDWPTVVNYRIQDEVRRVRKRQSRQRGLDAVAHLAAHSEVEDELAFHVARQCAGLTEEEDLVLDGLCEGRTVEEIKENVNLNSIGATQRRIERVRRKLGAVGWPHEENSKT
ncbi:MAG: hypothetical protein EOO70_05145 [Myxococcaceae bacterium]|nr:MAG: hypothetical protein EOO70_05145 [Myxococcaceae bacterium]